MKIRKTGWIVWDKENQKAETMWNRFVFSNKKSAWLAAGKERKSSHYKVVAVTITIKKKYH